MKKHQEFLWSPQEVCGWILTFYHCEKGALPDDVCHEVVAIRYSQEDCFNLWSRNEVCVVI